MIDQMKEVVRKERPQGNPFLEQMQREGRERQFHKEKEAFTNWMKEQWMEVEKDMEKRLRERMHQM
jgi:hypothetical protein